MVSSASLGREPTGAADNRSRLGEEAITRVLVALAAGNQRDARIEARKARKLLGESPQTLLLVAEAGRLSGREDEAEQAFQALTERSDAPFLGFRGLLRHAIDKRDWAKAEAIARQAEAAYPGTAWLREQRAELAIQTDNWAEAAELSQPGKPRSAYSIAAADAEGDPGRGSRMAKQAWKENPAFTPAVLSYARRLRSTGHETSAWSSVAEAWKRAPHPDLAEFAVAPVADPLARFQSAKRFVAKNPNEVESRIFLGRIALEAGLTAEARHQVEAAIADGVNQQRLWLLLAEIEEQEKGDTEDGRIAQREALRKAAIADLDPSWQCERCHTRLTRWTARCPSCGSVGHLGWQTGNKLVSLSDIVQ